jgi:hypothetical protein
MTIVVQRGKNTLMLTVHRAAIKGIGCCFSQEAPSQNLGPKVPEYRNW